MAKKKKVTKTLHDLKEEAVESKAPVSKSSVDSDVVTSRVTRNFKWGSKFSDESLAKWHLKRHGGKLVQKGKYYFLNK